MQAQPHYGYAQLVWPFWWFWFPVFGSSLAKGITVQAAGPGKEVFCRHVSRGTILLQKDFFHIAKLQKFVLMVRNII